MGKPVFSQINFSAVKFASLALSTLLLFFVFLACDSSAQVNVIGGLTRRHSLSPGSELQGKILVSNPGTESVMVKVYLTGYQAKSDGTTKYAAPEEAERSNASWVHLIPEEQLIAPRTTATFHYVVRVPDEENLTGTWWSMIMVHPQDPAQYEAPQEEKDDQKIKVGIKATSRTGIHLITNIGGGGKKMLKITDSKLQLIKQHRVLTFTLENTGERQLRLDIWAELFDEEGISIGRFNSERQGLLPGNSKKASIDLTAVPAGKYEVLIVADNGDDSVFGARYSLDITETKEDAEQ